ncbi:MAG: AAA family ATPase [Solirubrobacteraceae bacterium]
MKLVRFRVARFRNVVDSTEIEVRPDVTCIVGKNESGKTALLQALERVHPNRAVAFDLDEEYPRWLLVPDRRTGKLENARPVTAVFELEPPDHEAFEQQFGAGVLREGEVTAQKKYGEAALHFDAGGLFDQQRAVMNLLEREGVNPNKQTEFAAPSFVSLHQQLTELRKGAEADIETVDRVAAAANNLLGGKAFSECSLDLLMSRVPRFFYFGDYQFLPGRIDLQQLGSEAEAPASTGLQTARALLLLAQTDVTRLGEEDYEVRKAELEAVSNDLSAQTAEYWTQNERLRIEIDVDKETVSTPTGQTAVARFLDVRVRDERHGYTNNFDQRSTGFRWFFSFLAAFSEFENYPSGLVILLDEPALGLHARAQADFLRFINGRLAPAGQVIYTTHSPFMVETGRLERGRVVEDQGPKTGTIVSSDVLATDADTLFPLQAALGYDIAQSLFVAPHSLLVEGTSDFTYLATLSDHLREQGRTALDERFAITPTGGIQNIPTFVALLGTHLDVTVLIDSGTKGMQRLQDMANRGLLERNRLVAVGQVTVGKNADIEDLFTPGEYLQLYNGSTNSSLKVIDLPPGDRIVRRIAEKIGADFDHGIPADHLLRNKPTCLGHFGANTLDRFESLFKLLNRTLPQDAKRSELRASRA